MIANADFQVPGAGPGQALGWTLRSVCAQESIAAFAPGEPIESFARWTFWSGALSGAARAPFAPTGTAENFDAWPSPVFAFDLSAGAVGDRFEDAFEEGWADGARFAWSGVAQVPGTFGGAPREVFDVWRPGERLVSALDEASLMRALLHGAPAEMFEGAAWPTKNLTL